MTRYQAARRVLVALAAGGLASAVYQEIGSAWDRRHSPPTGELVDIGGRRLHLRRAGRGAPVVVVVSALGASGSEWAGVQHELARHTTVCVYDRAGLGWSDPAPAPRTAGRMAEELHRLLTTAAVPAPYVLVGHSLGGYVARLYAQRHRDMVAGMVLVESSHEDQGRRHRELRWGSWWIGASKLRLKPLGLLRLAADLGLRPGRAVASSRHRRADVREMTGFARSAAEVRAEAGPLGGLPLTVVTARCRPDYGGVWPAMQRELATLSQRSTHLVAEHSGHHVHRDEPEVVVRAIRGQVEQLRG